MPRLIDPWYPWQHIPAVYGPERGHRCICDPKYSMQPSFHVTTGVPHIFWFHVDDSPVVPHELLHDGATTEWIETDCCPFDMSGGHLLNLRLCSGNANQFPQRDFRLQESSWTFQDTKHLNPEMLNRGEDLKQAYLKQCTVSVATWTECVVKPEGHRMTQCGTVTHTRSDLCLAVIYVLLPRGKHNHQSMDPPIRPSMVPRGALGHS